MKSTLITGFVLCFLLLLGCAAPVTTPAPTHNSPTATLLPTQIPEAAEILEPEPLALSAPGPYHTGTRGYEFVDPNRDQRKVIITVYYPAIKPEDAATQGPTRKAAADKSGAPYPIVLSSAKLADDFATRLTSYGFILVGVNRQDAKDHWGQWLLDYPLDLVFALDQIASTPLDGLEGMLDTKQVGAMGYSFDGYNALALGGARIDPNYYLSHCEDAAALDPAPPSWWVDYICNMTGGWDQFVAYAGQVGVRSSSALWQPITDARIRAVVPMAPEGAWLFGDRGLEAVNRPMMIIGGTADVINFYDLEAAYIFNHLGTPDRVMISFVGQDHMMIWDPQQKDRMAHFAVAFLGYHLQGRAEYARYFSEEFLSQYPDLAWGVVTQ